MVKNERGSTLLVVMLMMLVFTILGLSIISTSIGGAKRTEVREEQITDDLESIRTLGEAVAYIKKTIETDFNKDNPDMSVSEYSTNIIEQKIIKNPYDYKIQNISNNPEYEIKQNEDFTRVLLVTSGKYKQIVYITGMPSFLKYAVGSRGILTLNGSTYIEKGNIYANEKLVLSNQAKYIYAGSNLVEDTFFPSVSAGENNQIDSHLFIENEEIEYCNNMNCYSGNIKNEGSFHSLSIKDLNNAFEPFAPIFSKEDTEFVDVDIIQTFKEKLKTSGFVANNNNPTIEELILGGMVSSSVQKISSFENLDNSSSIKGYLYVPPAKEEGDEVDDDPNSDIYIDTSNLIMSDKSKWVVIDGNAVIENIGNEIMNVSANILITGNLTIRGDIAFNSTIYVLGDTTINNVNISGYDDGELILMTQGKLEIARINKFKNDVVNSIKAYLYTDNELEVAEVYAMGSYLYIEGGIFAKGNLEVNAYRGTVEDKNTHIEFVKGKKNDPTSSRLIIKNNKKLFLNQAQGLPKINRLEVMTDLMSK
ncbi:hypothetical protein [Robertmurraya andreesenii]|uniref:Tfp pilus assembly protein PilX n=1 Tax=Anoxybacillus andreesenii TaxID=1325932 RepID=A0ABT9V5B9_9BACL|nr:hypothetical protein [Robertmurraya andreesenii]MDQ0156133.1 hypothetical protein [Robertmurraya andreesenii]